MISSMPVRFRSLLPRLGSTVRRLFDEENRVATVLFLVALVVYLPGLFWGLPHAAGMDRDQPWGTDEIAPFGFAEPYLTLIGDIRRVDIRYPLFPYMVQTLFCGPYIAWLGITGQLTEVARTFPNGLADPVTVTRNLTLLGRLPSLLAAAGVVAVACKTRPFAASSAGGDRAARAFDALAGAFVLSITLMFYYATTSNVDMLALFWTALAMAVVGRSLAGGFTVRRALLVGLFAALATATKDASYATFVAVLPVVSVWHLWKGRAEGAPWPDLLMAPAVCVASGLLAYVLTSGLLINPVRFGKHLYFITHGSWLSPFRQAYGSVPATLDGYLAATTATLAALVAALGVVALALAAVGLALGALRDRRALIFVLPAVAVFVGVILQVRFVEDRFVLPMAYFLAFFAAYAVWTVWSSRSRGARTAILVVFALGMANQVAKAAELEYRRIADKRYALATWFAEHARPGDRVGVVDGVFKLPALDKSVEAVAVRPGPYAERFLETKPPEFFVVMPVHRGEVVREHLLPDYVFERLKNGSLGYTQVLDLPKSNLFETRQFTYVDPPAKVFVRADVLARGRP
jgi:hypothetical protein